ncbi:MAG TPA: folylpolyglutamate synthase/dihydrofolate synthase family protein [Galbitalea sp.]|jgi:dihydrofolate synthase/folylpolyglutamate synthase|nr:folylpolyglutamate synthase/dihydrofolate synthase family protein [Galbitalea sp.]
MSKSDGDDREPGDFDDSLMEREAREVYEELLGKIGEAAPQPRLGATRRAAELLGDPQRAYPIIHITGTNGKTSTARMIESILRAHGLRTGMLTSPHLERVNERIVIDGEPISNAAFVSNWRDIRPFLDITDAELEFTDEPPLTFFEALTLLAFAAFADAPVDVVVLEVGMGGEWDSTNVADGHVAVFTPIALDHVARLGSTVAEIARTKSGIIKPAAAVVSAKQTPDALAELERAAELTESTLAVAGTNFDLVSDTVAVGGQVVTIRGLAAMYDDLFLPLFGGHQAANAALAVAAVESFIGGGTLALNKDVLAEGLATATSPGRLQVIGNEPTVLVDAAHNPHGAAALAAALTEYFTFDHVTAVIGILGDKDAAGIFAELESVLDDVIITQSTSDRAVRADKLAAIAVSIFGAGRVTVETSLEVALEAARERASATEKGVVLVTGSITLIGDAMTIARERGWKS